MEPPTKAERSRLTPETSAMAERTRLALNTEQWKALQEALDAPPRHHPRMERLLNEPTILD